MRFHVSLDHSPLDLLLRIPEEILRRQHEFREYLLSPIAPDLDHQELVSRKFENNGEDYTYWSCRPWEPMLCHDCGYYYSFRDLVKGHNDTCRRLNPYLPWDESGERNYDDESGERNYDDETGESGPDIDP